MTQQEYEQIKLDCKKELRNELLMGELQGDLFSLAFNRAYALGKQTETITQEEIEKAAEEFADEIKIPPSAHGVMVPFINGLAHDAYLQGAQDFIGKQESEDEVGEEIYNLFREKVQNNEFLTIPDKPEILDRYLEWSKVFKWTVNALGKQEKDAEAVIQGWVARDEDGHLFMYCTKPERDEALQVWMGRYADFDLRDSFFPDLTWESDSEPVEIIIKRKKNEK